MAFGKFKDTWFIWVLIIVAALFAFMALGRTKPKDQPPEVQDVLADKARTSVQAGVTATTIKPDHTAADMKGIAAQKAVAAVIIPLQEVAAVERLAVQVYSFKEKARAEAALKALKDKDFKAYIMVSDLGPRGIWYRVRVGAFSTEEEAQKILASITKDFKSGIIVRE